VTCSLSKHELSGTLVNYFGHCPRQAWLYSRGIRMEHESDLVREGKWIHEKRYGRKHKIELLGGKVRADFIEKKENVLEVNEVKSGKKPRPEHRLKLAYYLKILEEHGVQAIGNLRYPAINKIETFTLADAQSELDVVINEIKKTLDGPCPPPLIHTKCHGCAYFDFCHVKE